MVDYSAERYTCLQAALLVSVAFQQRADKKINQLVCPNHYYQVCQKSSFFFLERITISRRILTWYKLLQTDPPTHIHTAQFKPERIDWEVSEISTSAGPLPNAKAGRQSFFQRLFSICSRPSRISSWGFAGVGEQYSQNWATWKASYLLAFTETETLTLRVIVTTTSSRIHKLTKDKEPSLPKTKVVEPHFRIRSSCKSSERIYLITSHVWYKLVVTA